MERPGKNIWSHLSLEKKILLAVTLMILTLFISNIFIYLQVNKIAGKMDTVYASNVNLSELSEALEHVQKDMGDYVSVKSSDSLESYYKSQQEYQGLLERLNDKTIDKPGKILEKNIRMMSESYLDMTQDAVQAKRGRNVERYREAYERALTLYQYINTRISELNELQFKNNSASYQTMREALRYMEVFNMVILMIVMLAGLMVLRMLVKDMVTPLTSLARTANLVGQGNFNVKMPDTDSNDEIGIVTRTFNQMVGSLEEYVAKVKEGAEKEQELLERELLMENHLKEARLKYLQSQINPHFLFNTLNVIKWSSMISGAGNIADMITSLGILLESTMNRREEEVPLKEEIRVVKAWVEIKNWGLKNRIELVTDIQQELEEFKVIKFFLQPLVENAVLHGMGEATHGTIWVTAEQYGERVCVTVQDNGVGMEQGKLDEILKEMDENSKKRHVTGIGLTSIHELMKARYGPDYGLYIESRIGYGTKVFAVFPYRRGSETC